MHKLIKYKSGEVEGNVKHARQWTIHGKQWEKKRNYIAKSARSQTKKYCMEW